MHDMTAGNLRSAYGGESAAVQSMQYAVAAEKIHAEMYTRAKAAVDGGSDVQLGPIQICKTCGHTIEGSAPEACPICAAKKAMFQAFA